MNTYQVVVLGASGSGKTVFLASMYNKLSIQGHDISFYVSIPPTQSRLLTAKYRQIESGIWPAQTQRAEISKWEFTCHVQTKNLKNYPAMKFVYLDYAGGRLTDVAEDDGDSTEFDQRVEQADMLLGILDGQKIHALMSKKKFKGTTIHQDLQSILPTLQKCVNPIHFVITKWDLLECQYSLKEIRDELLKNPQLEKLVQGRLDKQIPIRLIPVSSVGKDFTILQPNGEMKIADGAIPYPSQVEMPLACILPDKLKVLLDDIIRKRIELMHTNIDTTVNYSLRASFGRFFGGVLRKVEDFLPTPYKFGEPILDKMIDYFEAPALHEEGSAAKRLAMLKQEREHSLKSVENEETALRHVVDNMLYLANKLEQDFPESNLSKLY